MRVVGAVTLVVNFANRDEVGQASRNGTAPRCPWVFRRSLVARSSTIAISSDVLFIHQSRRWNASDEARKRSANSGNDMLGYRTLGDFLKIQDLCSKPACAGFIKLESCGCFPGFDCLRIAVLFGWISRFRERLESRLNHHLLD